MTTVQQSFLVGPVARGLTEITAQVRAIVDGADLRAGLCHVFVHHTSAIDGRLALGRWQGFFLWEHRSEAGPRRITVTLQG